jgi:alpha-glucosidase
MWWRGAVTYQLYLRSFADGNGDGVGDLAGVRSRLPYIRDLGVDALWITPWYVTGMIDAGYDVIDHRGIDPRIGSLDEAQALIDEAHALGLRVIVDVVPNGCSDLHPWFRAALAAGPGAPERDRFFFRPGRGPAGDEPPNDWPSFFGGPAWTRTTNADGTPGEWYLRLFAPGQPDFNWRHPDLPAEFEDVLRFWFDRGLDGFRVDVAFGLVKEEGLPDAAGRRPPPYEDRPELHDIYRTWRRIADAYPGDRMFVGEVWVDTAEQLARYVRPDELHTAFNFPLLLSGWDADGMREIIDATLVAHGAVGAPPMWVLSNHDMPRHVTRYGRAVTSLDLLDRQHGAECDRAVGTQRARAAALLALALPGGYYLYQGEELGLWEVENLPHELLQDPTWACSGFTNPGREGSRVPMPWSGAAPPFGFGPSAWLPQPPEWRGQTVEAQTADADSMLAFYRRALGIRRDEPALGDGTMSWLDAPAGVLAFARSPGFACVVNLSAAPVALPDHRDVLLASAPLDGGKLSPDTAIWLRV